MSRSRARETSIYEKVLGEQEKIDQLIEKGYEISAVNETLEGAFVEFIRSNEKGDIETEELHIETADARIYFSNIIIEQQRAL